MTQYVKENLNPGFATGKIGAAEPTKSLMEGRKAARRPWAGTVSTGYLVFQAVEPAGKELAVYFEPAEG
jgi:hypothetical protein